MLLSHTVSASLFAGLIFQAIPGYCYPKWSPDYSCSLDSYTVVPNNSSGIWPYRQYKSNDATPPQFLITSNSTTDLAPGLIFFNVQDESTTAPGVNQVRPLIMASSGDLIWAGAEIDASNLHVQQLDGKPVLIYWNGTGGAESNGAASSGYGAVEILDNHYERLYSVCPKVDIMVKPGMATPNCVADTHESFLTSKGTMVVTVYNITTADLTPVGGPKNGWVKDSLAVEVNITTNEPLFVWSPLAHVPINCTASPLNGAGYNASDPFDWFHTNSIQEFDGHYLVNSRGCSTSYYVDQKGDIEWEINGKTGGSFGSLPESVQFSFEHHARIREYGPNQLLYTNFNDNNALPTTNKTSTGVGIILTLPPSPANHPPEVFSSLTDTSHPVVAYAEGSYSILSNNNSFLGYGVAPLMKEFAPEPKVGSGKVLWSAQFGYNNDNDSTAAYRAFKEVWHATPKTGPNLVVQKKASGSEQEDGLTQCAGVGASQWRGYVSWNGATDVTSYAIYAGQTLTEMSKYATILKKGFETEFVVMDGAKYVQVVAEDGYYCDNGKWDSNQGKSDIVIVE